MTDQKPTGTTGSPISRRIEPFWLNPATIKGTIAIIAGFVILAFPNASVVLIRIVLGAALVGSGLNDLWFHVVRGRRDHLARDTIEGLLAVVVGGVLLIYPTQTLRLVSILAGIYFTIRGLNVLAEVVRNRRTSPSLLDAARGIFLIVLAALLILLPEAIVSSLIVAAAVASVVLGAIVFAYGLQHRDSEDLVDVDAASLSEIVRSWILLQDVGNERRDEIDDGLYFEQPDRANKLVAWWVMLLLSVAIATFGILADSTAVVIGAMLIAPLMTPIIGAAAATARGRRSHVYSSFVMVAAGVAASIGLAFIIGAWAPAIVALEANSQVLSRVNPNVIDMAIAVAAGAAGAFAFVNKRVSNSIAGVAIAVALVPPLGVVGLTLHAGLLTEAGGAFLLFLTNLVSIILAAVVVFYLTGFAPVASVKHRRNEIKAMVTTVAIVAMVILVPLMFTAEGILSSAARQADAQQIAADWLADSDDLKVVQVTTTGTDVAILVTGSGSLPPIDTLGDTITETFGEPISLVVEHAPTVVARYPIDG